MKRTCLMIVDPGLQLWGSERALAATLKALTGAWDRVVLVTPLGAALAALAKDRAIHGNIVFENAPIGSLNKRNRGAKLVAMMRIAVLVAKHHPNRLYLNQAGLCRLIMPIVRLARIPFVIHVRLLEDVGRVAPLRGRPGAPLHKVYISDSMFKVDKPWEDAYTLINNAYDPYVFNTKKEYASKDLAAFVCVGRLSYGKGQHLLVEALASLELARAAVHFFGEGVQGDNYAENLQTRTAELLLDDRVVFQGFRCDVTKWLTNYRFLVSTSQYEPLGRVVMEAWEAGLVPIVYSGSGGAAEIVRKSGGGVLYEEWTPASLASALRQALALQDEARHAMARAGLEWGTAQLGIEQYSTTLRTALFKPDSQENS